jgi:hypothetical protein
MILERKREASPVLPAENGTLDFLEVLQVRVNCKMMSMEPDGSLTTDKGCAHDVPENCDEGSVPSALSITLTKNQTLL